MKQRISGLPDAGTAANTPVGQPLFATACFALSFMLLLFLGASPAGAETPEDQISPTGTAATASDLSSDQIVTKADKLDYNRETGWIYAVGNVVITKGNKELRADYVRVNVNTEDAFAFGNISFKRPGAVWTGENLHYNFKAKTAGARHTELNAKPFNVIAESSEKADANTYVLHDALITTCTNEHPQTHYHVRARKVKVVPDDHMKAYGATWYFGKLPTFYLPYWYRNLKSDFGFRFYPGYSSRMGGFLLSSLRYPITEGLEGETHLDYRSKRGLGGGQDLKWKDMGGMYNGELRTYYIDDDEPLDEDEDLADEDIDNQRYRVRLKHSQYFTARDYSLLHAHYLSDPDILEDFFEDEYRESRQPDNYATFTHRGEKYTAGIMARARLNDFYSDINRLPEVSLDFLRQEMWRTTFYYQGLNTASYLESVNPKGFENEDYSAFRLDSQHIILRPSKLFGFLNLVPRVGYRGTYYSKTLDSDVTVQESNTTVTNVVVTAGGTTNVTVVSGTQTNEVIVVTEQSGELRSVLEMGMGASFKAFKTWEDAFIPLRHIVEPHSDYTYIPEPDLLPENIYQFDDIDEINKSHVVEFGVRNKLQTKDGDNAFDLLDVDVFTYYNLDAEEDEDPIDLVFLDAELNPSERLSLDLEAEYSTQESTLNELNARLMFSETNLCRISSEFRYRNERSSLLSANLTLFPGRVWQYNLYGRYEFEESRFEEQGGYIQRNWDCLALRGGVNRLPGYERSNGVEVDDEIRFMLELWLTAFPESGLRTRHKH